VGSGSERLGGSDVGKRGCSSYRSVLSFRGPEAEQEKLESLVLTGDRIRAIREVKKLAHNRDRHRERSACRTGAACSGVRGGSNRIRAGGREEGAGIYPECRWILPRLS
jgi:hypothetical protein